MRGRLAVATLILLLSGCGGRERARPVSDAVVKIGKPYQVRGRTYYPRDDRDYDETGLASWYGGESGRLTANGERRDGRMTAAAHKTLPLPSYVEVTVLETGRKLTVRVNDRGPFAEGRIIDLSETAARRLGIKRDGIARVRVRRVYPSESERRRLRSGG
ncbi:septal ring lytic transglycosylase RlpA family protein [Sphingomonas jatrophae]|uniref:Endolytic peptidoglycan transglycosylase RlpA n=1 Tax=Sphingomonas jatrophae TaxID=1166337 RepID=A0A1I6JPA4_9SPHN|nr:septal ring lytic transglycosylase RlpA family protein [Sphingomonas jatrophae]SFR80798.1 rare lipoprotein A [Sphingomonas jatrophae]